MHHPKGSMCAACKHKDRDCSKLDFAKMPVMEKYNDKVIVRCLEFVKHDSLQREAIK